MKNLLNCHTFGLHSFPISFENGLYKRVFYADHGHCMWRPFEIAIHPHHVDIKITVLDGSLLNPLFEVDKNGQSLNKYRWSSHILNGKGGFEYLGQENIVQLSNDRHKAGDTVIMKACELHTVQVDHGKSCIWLIEEEVPTCEYFPINYSPHDLTKWSSDGLYIEVDDFVKYRYLGDFESVLKQIT